jgi:hypothetical protein
MRSRIVLLLLGPSLLLMIACAQAASMPVEHPDIVECGGPMAHEVAKRAATIAIEHAGEAQEQLEQRIAAEIEALAVDHGPKLVACLIDHALNAYRGESAALPKRLLLRMPPYAFAPINGVGFVPIERSPDSQRPWHTLLAGARGVRS